MLKAKLLGKLCHAAAFALLACFTATSFAGKQAEEALGDSVRAALSSALNDQAPPRVQHADVQSRIAYLKWVGDRDVMLAKRRKEMRHAARVDLLETVYYEAKRAGLEPELVLGLIQVESGFKSHAISHADARGLMQVMPFWTRVIGDGDAKKLSDPHINVRYGCMILRHYLDIEKGNLFRALGRYNGSLGLAEYPNAVLAAWRVWK